MGIKNWARNLAINLLVKRSWSLDTPDSEAMVWLGMMGGGSNTESGELVTPENAMTNAAVYSCVRIIAESIAGMPSQVFKRTEDITTPATEHPLYEILHDEPNPEMDSFIYKEFKVACLMMHGNAYSQIVRTKGGDIAQLWPMLPSTTFVQRNPITKLIEYSAVDVDNKRVVIKAKDVLHIKNLGFDGMVGKSPITLCREAIGTARAVEKYGSKFFLNGAQPSGTLKTPNELSDKAYSRLKEDFKQKNQGLKNAHETMILEQGLEYAPISLSPEDSQFLQTKGFQVEEIARIFRVPLQLLQHMEKATSWGTGIESLMVAFVVYTLAPINARIEAAMRQKLFSRAERKIYYPKFNVDGLLRGDIKTRYEAYGLARQWGFLNVNEIRKREDMNPTEHGDEYLRPANMTLAGTAVETPMKPIPDTDNGANNNGKNKKQADIEAKEARIKEIRETAAETFAKLYANQEATK